MLLLLLFVRDDDRRRIPRFVQPGFEGDPICEFEDLEGVVEPPPSFSVIVFFFVLLLVLFFFLLLFIRALVFLIRARACFVRWWFIGSVRIRFRYISCILIQCGRKIEESETEDEP